MPTAMDRRQILVAGGALALASCATKQVHVGQRRSALLVYDERGGLFVDASVARRPPVRFVLDTGASRSSLATSYAESIGLQLGDASVVEGTAGNVAARNATAQIAVPGQPTNEIDFLVYPFQTYDPDCVGILGYEVLSREAFQIRYREGRLLWSPAEPTQILPMELDGRIPRIEARANGVRLPFRIDTGATIAPSAAIYVNLAPAQARRLGLDSAEPERVFTATGTGGATLELPVHRLDGFELGSRSFPDAYAIVQPPVGYFARPEAVGFVGNSVLDGLDPFFDYGRGLFGFDERRSPQT